VNTKRAAAVLVALVLAETPSAIGAAAPELPWAVGTSWTYRVTVSRPNAFQSGTLKRAYGGRSTYRGKAVYSLDEDNTVVRGTEHDYFAFSSARSPSRSSTMRRCRGMFPRCAPVTR